MRRRLLQQDRGNTVEADHVQTVNTSPITEAEPTHAQGINCKVMRVALNIAHMPNCAHCMGVVFI